MSDGRSAVADRATAFWRANRATGEASSALVGGRLVIGDGAPGGAVEVIILAILERPEEADQTEKAEQQRQRYQKHQDFHQRNSLLPCRARSAFRITSSDEPDIAAAAISGVARPAIASGTANTL